MDYKYALKCIYNAHSADVRAVAPTSIPRGGLFTGSRDNTAKVWAPEGRSFKQSRDFIGATTYISSLCVLPESSQYPKGLFLAGSNDCSIYGFTPDSSEPILRLLGHSGPVCSLSYGKHGYLVSGSWDKTARVWAGQHCMTVLQGHLEAVWATAVFSTQNGILTGSADHTIRLWRSGVCEKVITGHKDCVRGLATISDTKFLSCSNDNTVRLWLITGECLEVFKSHTDYIYSITLLNNGSDFATCGEDQSIKIWRRGICAQTVVVAPKSLWSVACLSNGDLAIGTSDGKVYVLEKVPVDHFEKLSELSAELPDGNMLSVNGKDGFMMSEDFDIRSSIYNGETVIFYEYENNHMYVCKYNHESGTKVKKVPLDFQLIQNTFYNKPTDESVSHVSSKEKDYVFDVDVENNIYKLTFNKGENPWDVALKFVGDHNLPTDHVGQIVDFILENTVSSFTNEYFPAKKYIFYLNINLVGLRAKLLEFCDKVGEEKCISPSQIEELVLLAYFPDIISDEQLSSLDKAISWNDDFLFPVLDLLRLGVKCRGLRAKISSREFVNHLLFIFINTKKTVNKALIVKIFCNMFDIDEVEDVLAYYQEKIFVSLKESFSTSEKSIEKAGSALFLNFAIASYLGFNLNVDSFCFNVMDILKRLTDCDSSFRVLVAMGTICTRNSLAVAFLRSVNAKDIILSFGDRFENPKIKKVIEFLRADL